MGKKKSILRNWPILEFHLVIPFVEVGTSLWCERFETNYFEYVVVRFRVLKWSFNFRLYKSFWKVEAN